MPVFLTGAWALLSKRSTWIALAVTLGVLIAGFAITNYVALKSDNMAKQVQLVNAKATIEQYQANAKANQAAIASRNDLLNALSQVETVERVKTIEALKANPNWANQPIPADVLASLQPSASGTGVPKRTR